MSAVDDVDKLIEHYQRATAEFVKGNPEPYKAVFSHREDVTLANPFFPPVRGWDEVAETLERTASLLRAGVLGVDQGRGPGFESGEKAQVWHRLDQRPHDPGLRDAPRRLQAVGLRQGHVHVLPRGLHRRQARDGQA
jgi:hypothetical protein